MEKTRSIREIVAAACGAPAIAAAIVGAMGPDTLSVDAVYKWPHNGIPDRYWRPIMPMASTNEAELFAANEAARSAKAA